jgi:hypothetical protein
LQAGGMALLERLWGVTPPENKTEYEWLHQHFEQFNIKEKGACMSLVASAGSFSMWPHWLHWLCAISLHFFSCWCAGAQRTVVFGT